jgi:phosphoenolpyruvate synthase/pyruvate phosphate dikinase
VRTNADTPTTPRPVKFGAEGIGLCRTEHMFFAPERIPAVREMIVATTTEQRKKALAKLLPMQRGDFEGILRAMAASPSPSACWIRLCTSSCPRRTTYPRPGQGYGLTFDRPQGHRHQQLHESTP